MNKQPPGKRISEGETLDTMLALSQQNHEMLATGAMRIMTSALLDQDYYLEPIGDEPFEDLCLELFNSFSDHVLGMIKSYGRNNPWPYECLLVLVTGKADESDFIRTMDNMDWMMQTHSITDPDFVATSCLSFKTYDAGIEAHTVELGLPLKSISDYYPYYRALVGATFAMEDALEIWNGGTPPNDAYGKQYHDDDYVPPLVDTKVIDSPVNSAYVNTIGDPSLFSLIVHNVNRSSEIISFIRERKETHCTVISDFLSSHPSALAAGSL